MSIETLEEFKVLQLLPETVRSAVNSVFGGKTKEAECSAQWDLDMFSDWLAFRVKVPFKKSKNAYWRVGGRVGAGVKFTNLCRIIRRRVPVDMSINEGMISLEERCIECTVVMSRYFLETEVVPLTLPTVVKALGPDLYPAFMEKILCPLYVPRRTLRS